MKRKVKVRMVCKDGRIRTIRMNFSTFMKKIKRNELGKISFNKKLRRWVWRKTKIPEAEKKVERKVEKIEKMAERKKVEPKTFKVYAKIKYENKGKPYKNFYLDGYTYIKAFDEEEAKKLMRNLIEAEFPHFPKVEYHIEEVKEEEAEPFGMLLYKHRKEERWHQRRLKSYVWNIYRLW